MWQFQDSEQETAEIRQAFLDFSVVRASGSCQQFLVPGNPTLLFTQCRDEPVQDVFLGLDKHNYSRATTSSAYAGVNTTSGRNVGYTARHHTFFENAGALQLRRLLQTRRHSVRIEITDRGENGLLCQNVYGSPFMKPTTKPMRSGEKKSASRERIIVSATIKARHTRRITSGRWATPVPCTVRARNLLRSWRPHLGRPPGSPEEDGDRYIESGKCLMQFNRQADGTMNHCRNRL